MLINIKKVDSDNESLANVSITLTKEEVLKLHSEGILTDSKIVYLPNGSRSARNKIKTALYNKLTANGLGPIAQIFLCAYYQVAKSPSSSPATFDITVDLTEVCEDFFDNCTNISTDDIHQLSFNELCDAFKQSIAAIISILKEYKMDPAQSTGTTFTFDI